ARKESFERCAAVTADGNPRGIVVGRRARQPRPSRVVEQDVAIALDQHGGHDAMLVEAARRTEFEQRTRMDCHNAGWVVDVDVDESRHTYARAGAVRKEYSQPCIAHLHLCNLRMAV